MTISWDLLIISLFKPKDFNCISYFVTLISTPLVTSFTAIYRPVDNNILVIDSRQKEIYCSRRCGILWTGAKLHVTLIVVAVVSKQHQQLRTSMRGMGRWNANDPFEAPTFIRHSNGDAELSLSLSFVGLLAQSGLCGRHKASVDWSTF